MSLAVLDTDMLAEVFKRRNATVCGHAGVYLETHHQFSFSAITYFEVLRGLRHKRSARLLTQFADLCERSLIYPITFEVLGRAADLWSTAHSEGHSRRDADLIIGATAIEQRRTLVTGNTRHFEWMPGLSIVNWRDAL